MDQAWIERKPRMKMEILIGKNLMVPFCKIWRPIWVSRSKISFVSLRIWWICPKISGISPKQKSQWPGGRRVWDGIRRTSIRDRIFRRETWILRVGSWMFFVMLKIPRCAEWDWKIDLTWNSHRKSTILVCRILDLGGNLGGSNIGLRRPICGLGLGGSSLRLSSVGPVAKI